MEITYRDLLLSDNTDRVLAANTNGSYGSGLYSLKRILWSSCYNQWKKNVRINKWKRYCGELTNLEETTLGREDGDVAIVAGSASSTHSRFFFFFSKFVCVGICVFIFSSVKQIERTINNKNRKWKLESFFTKTTRCCFLLLKRLISMSPLFFMELKKNAFICGFKRKVSKYSIINYK